MHELSIATNLVNLIEEQQAEHQFERVSKIHLKIGEFSSVVPEALEFSFEIASKGSVAENAELLIEIIPLVLKCTACNKEFHTEPYIFVCPDCGSTKTQMVSGSELQIESIEV
jgi:hydrogenase nickel incorporation protein HypA/HybF